MSSLIQRLKETLTPTRARSDSTASTSGAARSDAQYRLPGELADDTTGKVKPPTYVDYLVKQDIRDHANSEHRNLVAELDPHAKLWVYDIALNVWDDWFEFVEPGDKNQPKLDDMDVVQDEFRRLRLPQLLMAYATPEERKHGWSLIYKVYQGARNSVSGGNLDEDTQRLDGDWLHFMGDRHAYSSSTAPPGRPVKSLQPLPTGDLMVVTCDQFNQPALVRYTPAYPEDEAPVGGHKFSILIHASRFWWLVPRPKDRSWKGVTALAPIWSTLVAMREILDNIGSYAGKYGAGLMKVRKKGPSNDALADEISTALQNVSKRRHLIINTNAVEDVAWETPNLSEHGPDGMLDACYGHLAAGTGLPKTRWYGAQAGNLEGSRTNLKIEWGVISAIQASYEPIIRAIVEDLFPGQFTDYRIKWKLEYQMDDKEQAELLDLKSRAVSQLAAIASIAELRELANLPKEMPGKTLAQEQQDALKDLAMTTGAGGPPSGNDGGGSSPASTSPPRRTRSDAWTAIRSDTFPAYVAQWEGEGWSRNQIIKDSEISRDTFYRYLNRGSSHELRL
jgi:hypothetical protein